MSARFARHPIGLVAVLVAVVTVAVPTLAVAGGSEPALAQAPGPAIGTYPPVLQFGRLGRGGESVEDLGLINGTETRQDFKFQTAGEIAPWLTFVRADGGSVEVSEVSVPASSDGHVGVRILVPEDAPNGTYTGSVTVLGEVTNPDEPTASPVQVGSRVGVAVSVVGEQVISGTLTELTVTPVLEVGMPLHVRPTVANSGNVSIRPTINLGVLAGSRVVDQTSGVDGRVTPDTSGTLNLDWKTDGLTPGDYGVVVNVTVGGISLGEKTATFKAVPRGTLTRNGRLGRLEVVGGVQGGGLTRVRAPFTNEGEAEAEAVLRVEVRRDGTLVEEVTGTSRLALPGQAVGIDALVPTDSGSYRLVAVADYLGTSTEPSVLEFDVASSSPLLPIAAAVAVVLALLIGLVLWRRRRRRPSSPPGGRGRGRGYGGGPVAGNGEGGAGVTGHRSRSRGRTPSSAPPTRHRSSATPIRTRPHPLPAG